MAEAKSKTTRTKKEKKPAQSDFIFSEKNILALARKIEEKRKNQA